MQEGKLIRGIILPKKEKKDYRIPFLHPLTEIKRKDVYGIPVALFPLITGLSMDQLYKKLVPNKFLVLVKRKGRNYILKDYYWNSLLEFLKHQGKPVMIRESDYVRLKNSVTI